jgi:putative DNA primase/helicase
VLSAEAGAVFGAHGMGQDTILRNLALLNVLWDGGEIAIDRLSPDH